MLCVMQSPGCVKLLLQCVCCRRPQTCKQRSLCSGYMHLFHRHTSCKDGHLNVVLKLALRHTGSPFHNMLDNCECTVSLEHFPQNQIVKVLLQCSSHRINRTEIIEMLLPCILAFCVFLQPQLGNA